MKYKNIFFDLDDTLWAFSENSYDTFKEMYDKHGFGKYFYSFEHYYLLYLKKNEEAWELYGKGEINKQELNRIRFLYPLQIVGVENCEELARAFSEDYFRVIPTKEKLMPQAKEILEYLQPKYNLYILSNGFRELQSRKMHASGIDQYFKKVILSEDLGVMKPSPQIFHFALSATQSELRESIMVGDNWKADITGANNAGMHQIFYNFTKQTNFSFRPTYIIESLSEIKDIL